MPLHRRLPKRGFKSLKSSYTEQIRLGEIDKLGLDIVNLATLIECGAVKSLTRQVKIFLSGKITKPVKVQGVAVSKAVKSAIETAGGSVESSMEKEKSGD